MIVLHLSYFNGSCYLWGETPAKEFTSRRGRPPKKPKPRPSPFDVSPEQLQQALELAGFKNSNQTGAGMVAWMPSLPDRPLASSLVVDQPLAEREPELRPWKVTTLPLTAADVIAFLLFCDGQRQLSPALLLGPEFFVWMQILRYGASLVMRGRFLPTLKKENGTYAAAWEPVLAGEDLETVANLVNAMTAACYCLTEGPEFDTQASAVVMEFLALITNQLVRRAALSVAGIMKEGRGKGAVLGNTHQRWLAALKASAPPQLEGSLAELASLGHQIAEWQRRAYTLSAAPYRFCFRLEEPQPTEIDANNGTWTLRYLLQAREDPSFLLSTATAWSSNRKLKISGDSLAGRREFILTALGQAASLSTVIKDSMQARIPTVAELDSNSAFDFLSHQAPLLRQAGFMLMLPAWWTNQGPRTKLAVKGRASPAGFSSAASFNLDDVVSFEWQVAVGDEVLTEKELATLAELKSPLLRLRGQWVQVDVNGIQAALRFWHKKASEPLTARDLIRLSLGAADQPDHLPLDCVTGSSWLKDVLRRLQGLKLSPDLPQPLLLKGELRPYQRRGYSWLKFLSEIGFGACLADDMGLGKTIQCLALFQHRWAQGLAGPALLVCPTSVIANWEKESARFTPELPLQVHHGPSRLKDKKFINMVKGKALVITSYALLGRDKDFLNQVQWDGVVLD
ncbi:MAG TPA: SNF2 helicase-associated domain-containing protein, partial [bacterium]|nr:SNF2 helicase-associated domain-containing protein [bacterium]